MKLGKGNTRSTISVNDLGIESPHSKTESEKNILVQITILIAVRHNKNKSKDTGFVQLWDELSIHKYFLEEL